MLLSNLESCTVETSLFLNSSLFSGNTVVSIS